MLTIKVDKFSSQISAMAIIHSFYDMSMLKNETFSNFLANRARSWIWSAEPVNTPISDSLAEYNSGTICPTFSGGEENDPDLIIIRAREKILDWLTEASNNPRFVDTEYSVVEDEKQTTAAKTADVPTNDDKPNQMCPCCRESWIYPVPLVDLTDSEQSMAVHGSRRPVDLPDALERPLVVRKCLSSSRL
jgi:hypothetical protein